MELVSDINPNGPSLAEPDSFTEVGGVLYFAANDGETGRELWRTDGTAAGTRLVKDIQPGPSSSLKSPDAFGTSVAAPVNVNGTLYFVANDGVTGYELWKSDGTSAGTVRIKNIFPDAFYPTAPTNLTNVGGTLYFTTSDGNAGNELWKSDGTTAGTVLVKDIRAGAASANPRHLVDVNGTLYFAATDGTTDGLWKSDGTAAGTVRVENAGPAQLKAADQLINVGGTLYFFGNDGTSGYELWKSDGTTAGTVQVKEIQPGAGPSSAFNQEVENVAGVLYFTANDGASGYELWKSDGTAAGTTRIKDISSGTANAWPSELTNVDGVLYFIAADTAGGRELWRSDGLEAGTVRVKDIVPGAGGSAAGYLTNAGGMLYFSADNGSGSELWRSDGTEAGTILVRDINTHPDTTWGTSSSSPRDLFSFAGKLYFSADTGDSARELWGSDGTSDGTQIVTEIAPGADSSSPQYFANVQGTTYFLANDGTTGLELWKVAGPNAKPVMVKDIRPGVASSQGYLVELTAVGGLLYFIANDGSTGEEIWKSDGTAEGTVLVKDIVAGSGSSAPSELTEFNGLLYFTAYDASAGYELWKSDGTADGTVRVKDINPGTEDSIPRGYIYGADLTNVNGTLYFAASDGTSGRELWKSDGTESGTVLVKDILPDYDDSFPAQLTNVNGTLYFSARDYATGRELWKSDGTNAGTIRVADIYAGSVASYPQNLTVAGGTLFFAARSSSTGYELWKSDGTAAGTVLVRDIAPGTGNGLNGDFESGQNQLANVAGTLFFFAKDAATGNELWKSDGTAAGTVRVKDIVPGSGSAIDVLSSYGIFTVVGEQLYFTANDGTNGVELWRSDGTAAGTAKVRTTTGHALNAGEAIYVGDVLYIRGGTELEYVYNGLSISGVELWRLNLGLTGDYDRSNAVDSDDLAFWKANFGATSGLGLQADGNGDGQVDAADYTVWRDHVGATLDDHGDTPQGSTPIVVGTPVAGVLSATSDQDWFRITTTGGYEYRLDVDALVGSEVSLELFDTDGVSLVASDTDGQDATVTWTARGNVTYYARLTRVGTAQGAYNVSLFKDDHAANTTSATLVLPASVTSGLVDSATDRDWFGVNLTAGIPQQFRVQTGTVAGATLRVFDVNGATVLASDTDGGQALLSWTPAFTSRYFVEVAGFGGAVGSYQLFGTRLAAGTSIDFVGASITENFDALSSTTVANVFSATAGTQVEIAGVPGFSGTKRSGTGTTPSALSASDGTGVSGGIYSFGAAGDGERALGAIASASNIMAFGFSVKNATSDAVITSITVSFKRENWRTSTTTRNTIVADYLTSYSGVLPSNYLSAGTGTAITALDLLGSAPVATNGALNGNSPVNQIARTATISNLTLGPNDRFYLRWRDTDETGNDAGLAVDDLTLSFVTVPLGGGSGGGAMELAAAGVAHSSAHDEALTAFAAENLLREGEQSNPGLATSIQASAEALRSEPVSLLNLLASQRIRINRAVEPDEVARDGAVWTHSSWDDMDLAQPKWHDKLDGLTAGRRGCREAGVN